jgi:hypothetical protein
MLIEAGTCTTGTLGSVPVVALPELVWVRSPPPHALAVLVTEVGEAAGTLTTRLIVELLPPAMAVVELQATALVPVPLHVHPVPEYEASV